MSRKGSKSTKNTKNKATDSGSDTPPNEDDEHPTPDFATSIAGVKPLGDRDKRVRAKPSRVRPAAARKAEPAADPFENPDPNEPRLAHRRSVNAATLGRLVGGAMPVDRKLDLHGMRAEPAHDALRRALVACAKAGDSILLLVHGRGKHTGGFAVLRDALPDWLEAEGRVLAFAPASGAGDPAGATCVLLRTTPRDR